MNKLYLTSFLALFFFSSITGLAINHEKIYSGVCFDGSDDVVIVPHSDDLNAKEITVEAWIMVKQYNSVKYGSPHHWQFILFKKNKLDDFNEGFAIFFDDSKHRFAATVASGEGIQKCVASPDESVLKNKWYHVCITANGKELRLYIDGKLSNSISTGFPLDFDDKPIYIGGRETDAFDKENYDGKFNGIIDEVKIWNKILTPEQINSSLNLKLSDNNESLIAYFKFDECGGNISQDKSGYGHIGILLNNASWNCEQKTETDIGNLSIFPNPVQNNAVIRFNLLKQQYVEVKVYNSNGEYIHTVFSGELIEGAHEIPADFSGNAYTSGSYTCTLKNEAITKSVQFVVVK